MAESAKFICQECGYESFEWLGKCPECGEWNSLKQIIFSSKGLGGNHQVKYSLPKSLSQISVKNEKRILTGFKEMDGVLGGGITLGSVNLLAGDPGIGKSTLLLQVALNVASSMPSKKILYVSAEESEGQVVQRLLRLKKKGKQDNLLILSTTSTDNLIKQIEDTKPSFVVIDSIQTISSVNVSGLSGSVPQVRYAALEIINLSKANNIPVVIVGHVTKEGLVAGPMVLSHMVDCVLFLEGEKTVDIRMLRSFKNRFGPIDEVGIFMINSEGMTEVNNPEQVFLTEKSSYAPGSTPVVILEGSRPFLVEIQALAVFSKLVMPRRVVSGLDHRRLELLLAVLQKHCSLPVETMDIFVSVAGGLRINDPAADLAVCLAIFSSIKNISLGKIIGIAEVGLLGELRKVAGLDKRAKEARKMGFQDIISPFTNNYLKDVLQLVKRS